MSCATSSVIEIVQEENPLLKKMFERNSFYIEGFLKNKKTVYIFDFDDTIFPSTFLMIYKEQILTKNYKEDMLKLENTIINTLEKLENLGFVIIVTNSAPGWVEYICKAFFPKILNVLQKYVTISTREWFGSHISTDVSTDKNKILYEQAFLCKYKAFDWINNYFKSKNFEYEQIIHIGDAIHDREAFLNVFIKEKEKDGNRFYVKSIKFQNNPRLTLLLEQWLEFLNTCEAITSYTSDLDLQMALVLS
jgi:histidinol phosphatase-like enzyme